MRPYLPLLVFVIVYSFSAGPAFADDLPPRIKAVQDYVLKKDYPELFGQEPYRVQVEDIIEGDLDGDGADEVVMLVKPHYRQSPTIIIFQVSKDLKVKRVIEGLAPGALKPLSGDYLDSHTLGMGIDLTLDEKQVDPKRRKAFIKSSLGEMGAVVEYRSFFHLDGRKGKLYIDMTHVESPKKDPTCAKFEFSEVDKITVASKEDGSGNYLLALVGKELYVYKIHKITKEGMLEKSITVKRVE